MAARHKGHWRVATASSTGVPSSASCTIFIGAVVEQIICIEPGATTGAATATAVASANHSNTHRARRRA